MIDLHSRTFATADALTVCKLSSGTLQNWGARDLLTHIGKVRGGRRMYHVGDLVALRIMSDLTQTCAVTPSFASAISEPSAVTTHNVMELTEAAQLRVRPPSVVDEQDFILAWADRAADRFSVRRCIGAKLTEEIAARGAHPVIVVPLSVIWFEVLTACYAIVREEGQ